MLKDIGYSNRQKESPNVVMGSSNSSNQIEQLQ